MISNTEYVMAFCQKMKNIQNGDEKKMSVKIIELLFA